MPIRCRLHPRRGKRRVLHNVDRQSCSYGTERRLSTIRFKDSTLYAPLRSLTDTSGLEEPLAYELLREAEPTSTVLSRTLDW